jgi:hypothetical protein
MGNQGTGKSGWRISENQDIRKGENERILKPDALYPDTHYLIT